LFLGFEAGANGGEVLAMIGLANIIDYEGLYDLWWDQFCIQHFGKWNARIGLVFYYQHQFLLGRYRL
jgi:hypothetical protein